MLADKAALSCVIKVRREPPLPAPQAQPHSYKSSSESVRNTGRHPGGTFTDTEKVFAFSFGCRTVPREKPPTSDDDDGDDDDDPTFCDGLKLRNSFLKSFWLVEQML